jgi:hypothetical protein
VQEDRRLYQRLHLTEPLPARFGKSKVRLLDVSATGALAESRNPLAAGSKDALHFSWRGREVSIQAEVVRTADLESGLHFTEESAVLWELISESAEEVLRAQQANMDGDRESNVVGEETLTSASAGLGASGYVVWTLTDGGWKKRRALLGDQPADGFCVSAAEPADQVELLRQTWENGDEETRRMTRMLAELSAASVRIR